MPRPPRACPRTPGRAPRLRPTCLHHSPHKHPPSVANPPAGAHAGGRRNARCRAEYGRPFENLIPATTKCLVARARGRSVRDVAAVMEREVPELREGEVLVQVCYVGINGGCETFRARAEYAFASLARATDFPLGSEGVGVVVKTGRGVTLRPGQAVAYIRTTFTEWAVLPASKVMVVPQVTREAVTLPVSAVVACTTVQQVLQVKAGDRVLVTAGAGALGSFAVQFAKAAGALVTTIVGSPEKGSVASRLGADMVVDRRAGDVAGALRAAAPGGFDAIMDGSGGPLQDTLIDCLAAGGTMALLGYIAEYPHNENGAVSPAGAGRRPSNADIFWKGLTVDLGDGRRLLSPRTGSLDAGASQRAVLRAFSRGELVTLVDGRAFEGLEAIPDAVEYMLSGQAIGKVVVALRGFG